MHKQFVRSLSLIESPSIHRLYSHTSIRCIPPPAAARMSIQPDHQHQPNNQNQQQIKPSQLSDDQLLNAVHAGKLRTFNLENDLDKDYARAVNIRRQYIESKTDSDLSNLPYDTLDYNSIHGQCCENVIGAVQIPVGVAGPLLIDGVQRYVPLATTEGALVASTSRGAKAISLAGGSRTELVRDGMTRAPLIQAPNISRCSELKRYIDNNFDTISAVFNSTSRYARLQSIQTTQSGRLLYVRMNASSGEAMGMNMVGKGSEAVMKYIVEEFNDVTVMSLSGNLCTDKKSSAINWTQGRGKSIVAECRLSYDIVSSILKSSPQKMVELNIAKNLIGSAMAGSIGGYNAHAANIVAAIFIATGQDPAQVVDSSQCMTTMECMASDNVDKPDLYITITMPCIEVGTIGGGTTLAPQRSMINLLGITRQHGDVVNADTELHSSQLARVIASTVMAGELSLMAAHAEGHLISSHLKLNRKTPPQANTVN